MLDAPGRLSPADFAAVEALEAAVVAADGGRLKLEKQYVRTGDRVQAVLWREGGAVVGFCGAYRFGEPAEIAGMVHPDHRRRGIGDRLLRAALERAGTGGAAPLLVVPRHSTGGRVLAERHGGVLDHSEHALVLEGPPRPPAARPDRPDAVLRRATLDDAGAVSRILAVAFAEPERDVRGLIADPDDATFAIEVSGAVVGTVRTTVHDGVGGVYGFAIDPSHQGRGIGRDVLHRVCEQLRAGGAVRVGLEVEVDNDRALELYTSTGFVAVSTEDYYPLTA